MSELMRRFRRRPDDALASQARLAAVTSPATRAPAGGWLPDEEVFVALSRPASAMSHVDGAAADRAGQVMPGAMPGGNGTGAANATRRAPSGGAARWSDESPIAVRGYGRRGGRSAADGTPRAGPRTDTSASEDESPVGVHGRAPRGEGAAETRADPAHGLDDEAVTVADGATATDTAGGGSGWAALIGRRVPPTLRGARLDPGRRAAASVLAVALVAAAVVALVAWRTRPSEIPVQPPDLVAPAGPTSAGPSPPQATGPATIVVALAGKVRRPGVVTVPAGSRVIDAVRAAGGPLPGTDFGLLNLARPLADGELVVVGVAGVPDGRAPGDGAAGTAAGGGSAAGGGPVGAGAPVNLNAATLEQLETLPGVGPVLAQRIVDWRTANGQFTSVDQLREVDGIGDARFDQLRDRVTV
jgi:competence protein ComEA